MEREILSLDMMYFLVLILVADAFFYASPQPFSYLGCCRNIGRRGTTKEFKVGVERQHHQHGQHPEEFKIGKAFCLHGYIRVHRLYDAFLDLTTNFTNLTNGCCIRHS